MLLNSLPHSIFSSPKIHHSMNIACFMSLVSCLWTLNLPISFAIKAIPWCICWQLNDQHIYSCGFSKYNCWVQTCWSFRKFVPMSLFICSVRFWSPQIGVICEPQETPDGVASFSMEKSVSEPQVKHRKQDKRAENKHHPLHSGLVDKMANRGSSSLREESSCKWQNVPKVSSFYIKLHCIISIITINKMNTIMWVLALCWALCQKLPLNHSEILMGAGAGWTGPDPDIHCPLLVSKLLNPLSLMGSFSSTIPPPLPPPGSNHSCLFTGCQPLSASCCSVWLYFSRWLLSSGCVRLFVTPWTTARQAPLPFTISRSLLKLMSIELVMPYNTNNIFFIFCSYFFNVLLVWNYFSLSWLKIYLAALGLSCGTWDLHCILEDLSLQCTDSLVVMHRLSSCGTQPLLLHGTWDLSSQTRDRTCDPCIARQIINHWPTREVPCVKSIINLLQSSTIIANCVSCT